MTAVIETGFFLEADDKRHRHSATPTLMERLELEPIPAADKRQTGQFKVEVRFPVTSKGDPQAHEVAAVGRDIFAGLVDALAFLSGRPVKALKPPVFNYDIPGTNKHRHVNPASEMGSFPPLIPLRHADVILNGVAPEHARILYWLRRGLEEQDPTNSLFHLCTGLELLSNRFHCPLKPTRECPICHRTWEIKPGTGLKVEHFLTQIAGLSAEEAEKVWSTRVLLTHGTSRINTETRSGLSSVRAMVIRALIIGIKRLMGIKDAFPPEQPEGPPFSDAILDVTWHPKPDGEGAPGHPGLAGHGQVAPERGPDTASAKDSAAVVRESFVALCEAWYSRSVKDVFNALSNIAAVVRRDASVFSNVDFKVTMVTAEGELEPDTFPRP